MVSQRAWRARSVAVLALLGGALMAPLTRAAPADEELPGRLVGDLHRIFGEHHARAAHAKGIVLTGHFVPSADARGLSSAAVFTASGPVTVRFSDTTGLPAIPDASPDATPHGLAVKFALPDGATYDVVTHSFNGFAVAKAAEFATLLEALMKSGPGVPKPTPAEAFLADHPRARVFLTTQKPPPESFATTAYFGVNAFAFVDKAGHRQAVRTRFVPVAGEHYLPAAVSHAKGANYLMDEIGARVAKGPVRFTWVAQLAGPGDRIDDPSVPWPETRRQVVLGTVTIDKVARLSAEEQKALLFMPGSLPDGIEAADPMIDVRNAAYPISFARRQ